MTYNVFGGTLNLTQPQPADVSVRLQVLLLSLKIIIKTHC